MQNYKFHLQSGKHSIILTLISFILENYSGAELNSQIELVHTPKLKILKKNFKMIWSL